MFYKIKYGLNYLLELEERLCSKIDKRKNVDFAERYVDGAIKYNDEIIHYETIRRRQFKKVFKRFVEVSGWNTGHRILDYGCGKGYMLYLLSKNGHFDSISGLEILPELCEVARHNMNKLGISIDIIEGDARDYTEIDLYDVFFLFNPFPNEAMQRVTERIDDSLKKFNRKIYIIYINDVYDDVVLENISGIHIVDRILDIPRFGCNCSIYSN